MIKLKLMRKLLTAILIIILIIITVINNRDHLNYENNASRNGRCSFIKQNNNNPRINDIVERIKSRAYGEANKIANRTEKSSYIAKSSNPKYPENPDIEADH